MALLLDQRHAEVADTLTRRRWIVTHNVVTYVKAVQDQKNGALHGMVAARNLSDVTPRMFVQLIGGFLTTSAWVNKALLSQSSPPEGVFYKGLSRSVPFTFFLSEQLRASSDLNMVVDILTVLASRDTIWKVCLVGDEAELVAHCEAYISKHGPRSRPSTSIAALCLDNKDKRSVQLGFSKEYKHLVQEFGDFLAAHSHVDRSVPCAGQWKFG